MHVPPSFAKTFNRWLFVGSYRERAVKDDSSAALVMKPSRAQQRFAWMVWLTTPLMLVFFMSEFGVNPSSWWWPAALFCSIYIAACVACLYASRRRIYISNEGLLSKRPFAPAVFIPWSDIESVRFRQWGRTLRIHGKRSGAIVIPSTMSGARDLESTMRAKLPFQVFSMAFMKYRASLKDL